MKQISAVMIIGIFLFIVNSNTFSQNRVKTFKTTILEPYHLSITFYKTTNLIFPYTIKSVDRGSKDVLVQRAKGVENILLVKAGRENFMETNLSVITSDGKLYSFILNYSNNPLSLNISFAKDTSVVDTSPLLQSGSNEALLQLISERIARKKKMLHGIKDYKYRIKLQLNGIYIKNNIIFYQLGIKNHSNINYDINKLRFFIIDEKKTKRTASQEIEMQPLYMYGETSIIKGHSTITPVFALPK